MKILGKSSILNLNSLRKNIFKSTNKSLSIFKIKKIKFQNYETLKFKKIKFNSYQEYRMNLEYFQKTFIKKVFQNIKLTKDLKNLELIAKGLNDLNIFYDKEDRLDVEDEARAKEYAESFDMYEKVKTECNVIKSEFEQKFIKEELETAKKLRTSEAGEESIKLKEIGEEIYEEDTPLKLNISSLEETEKVEVGKLKTGEVGKENTGALVKFNVASDLVPQYYTENNGAINRTDITLQIGTLLIRLGDLNGRYLTRPGAPIDKLGLDPSTYNDDTKISFIKTLRQVKMESGIIKAAFDSDGGEIQFFSEPMSVEKLQKNGFVEVVNQITVKEYNQTITSSKSKKKAGKEENQDNRKKSRKDKFKMYILEVIIELLCGLVENLVQDLLQKLYKEEEADKEELSSEKKVRKKEEEVGKEELSSEKKVRKKEEEVGKEGLSSEKKVRKKEEEVGKEGLSSEKKAGKKEEMDKEELSSEKKAEVDSLLKKEKSKIESKIKGGVSKLDEDPSIDEKVSKEEILETLNKNKSYVEKELSRRVKQNKWGWFGKAILLIVLPFIFTIFYKIIQKK